MMLLAPFVGMRAGRVGVIGIAIVALQQLLALVPQIVPASARHPFGYV
jgi:hypothetical protein